MGEVGVGVVEAGEPEKEKEILRVKSAQSIQPGCQQWVIAAWAPKETKPQKRHLQEEVARRGGAVVKTWTPQQLADWLLVKPAVGPLCAGSVVVETLGVEARSQGSNTLQREAASEAQSQPGVHSAPVQASSAVVQPAQPAQRWHANRQGARLLHAIYELKDEFLQRDKGHRTRNEKEAAARNSFWVTATAKFNDASFKPSSVEVIRKIDNMPTQVMLEEFHINPSVAAYAGEQASMLWWHISSCCLFLIVGTPEKLEKEFNTMRALLEPCLAKFRLSGMGDCPSEEKHAQSLSENSSNFSSFCVSKPIVAYLYELLVREQDLLAHIQQRCLLEAPIHPSTSGQSRALLLVVQRGR